ncbi:MAG TPA: hypothetical protein PKH97_04530 [Tetrasphaera sp.]|uniref:hypothetical protein n=1 Tax=Nostocoides sp. TaxID=1917966 RepID=UPI002C23357C|nr:hypothetical protein [Tetrasphaera sp.]HNQ06435.1 hypothetical protein [Tetrasphaera sp.]
MKTTIDLPDALAAEAREVVRQDGTTLRALIIDGLRSELDRRREGASAVEFFFETFPGQGLASDLEPADAIARSYGLTE